MSYVPTGMTEDEYRDRTVAVREEMLELRKKEVDKGKYARFWSIAEKVATVGIPLITFLGWQRYFKKGK